ncbi:hypothetical protein Athai_67580 [Actinocatenispora thailandica]|uniref:Phospholipid/glycerol acyltransferase domain-containing protein n=1 Tax=Actinocatenispora thailandica TaxID=227318 RepID=A0A7R7DWP1_9ACTN|nr:hypothetical protein [Actinocatenispora thailandica]BCJ39255.1 hypothetical protein Athai_67580 [Actinocatenispora thailandica]
MIDAVLRATMDRVLRRGLGAVWVRGGLPPGPVVWAANHHSWWDPFVAAGLVRRAGRQPALLMDQASLNRYPFARRVGGFGTDELPSGIRSLRAGRVLVIYPEGRLTAPGPPGRLAAGAGWYARHAPARLLVAATRVALRGEQRPSAYVTLTELAVDGDVEAVTAALSEALRGQLSALDTALAEHDPRLALPGFRRAVTGRLSWDQRVDRLRRGLPW